MKGTIIKLHQLKNSRNGNAFRRVEFRMEDNRWAKTDLCPDFRNYGRWVKFLRVGQELDGLTLKGKTEVDADSYPQAYIAKTSEGYWENNNGTMRWIEPEEVGTLETELPELNKTQQTLL